MKTLPPITVGDYTVEISVKEDGPHGLRFYGKCGEIELQATMNPSGPHDHPEEQFEKDIDDRALLLAKEIAGKCRARDLRAKFLK